MNGNANLLRFLTFAAVLVPALALAVKAVPVAEKAEPRLAHMVFFTLKDRSAESVDAFVDSCNKYLSGHPGTVFFAAGLPRHIDASWRAVDEDPERERVVRTVLERERMQRFPQRAALPQRDTVRGSAGPGSR